MSERKKLFNRLIIAFVIVSMGPAFIFLQLFNNPLASLAWIFAMTIGQGFGQLLSPFYKKAEP